MCYLSTKRYTLYAILLTRHICNIHIMYKIVGERFKVGPRASVQTYPYDEANPTGPARTREQTLKYAVVTASMNDTVSPVEQDNSITWV